MNTRYKLIALIGIIISAIFGRVAICEDLQRDSLEPLSLKQAVSLALEGSPDITITRLIPEKGAQDLLEEKGTLDTELKLEAKSGRIVTPSGSVLTGTEYFEANKLARASLGRTLLPGTRVELFSETARTKSDVLFTSLSPQWDSQVGMGIVQPLLKGTWKGSPWSRIRAKENLSRASQYEFIDALSGNIERIIAAYWRQKLAESEVSVRSKTLKLAKRLLKEADALVEVGLQAPIAISQAKARASLRKGELLSAENSLVTNANELKRTLGIKDLSYASSPLVLTDEPSYFPVDIEEEASLNLALENNPILKALKLKEGATKLGEAAAKNYLLPELNIVARGGYRGLAGTPRSARDATNFDPDFLGGFSESVDLLNDHNFYNYEAGLEIVIPLENRGRRARYERAKSQNIETRAVLESTTQEVVKNLKNQAGSIRTARERIEAAKDAKEFAGEALLTGEERYKAGLDTTTNILELQSEVADSELNEVQALVDYQLAVLGFYRARGDLLEHLGIESSLE